VNLLQNEVNLKRKIKDWGLSHTTLEEVFMKVRNFSKIIYDSNVFPQDC